MDATYLFYDIETSGLSKTFDQVLQFAAIRTDENLDEIERYEIRVTLNPDTIMHPMALITHRIDAFNQANALGEYEAIQKIHAILNAPGTISLGYNTLGFDDEFLRFSFFRNLLTPYTHQYANRCGRMDLYPMVVMTWLFKPALLQWPEKQTEQGKRVSFKLEDLNRANQLAEGQAHDAMVDVEVTLALTKKLKQDPAMWQYLSGYFQKSIDGERAAKLTKLWGQYPEAIYVNGSCGFAQKFHFPVIGLGEHKTYRNQTLWLRLDDERLLQTKIAHLDQTTWVVRKKWGEPGFLLPTKPAYCKHLSDERKTIIEKNKTFLLAHPDILEAIQTHYTKKTYDDVDDLDPQAALYQMGFMSDADARTAYLFHRSDWARQCDCIEQFQAPELQALAVRLLGRLDATQLPAGYQDDFHEYLAHIWQDGVKQQRKDHRGDFHLTAVEAQEEITRILAEKELDNQQLSLLDAYQTQLLVAEQST
ncbi:MAG: exodeoxyribonuclease I [marine bacterium B5-7]|nr:MAG: exodeoxyribonuclease I [marine bacterium B5-7]